MPAADPGHASESEIATTTLAEIYVQQGLYERALAIYRRIAVRAPQDGRVAERIEELTRRLRGEEPEEPADAAVEIPVPVDAPAESDDAGDAEAAGIAGSIPVPAETSPRGEPAADREEPAPPPPPSRVRTRPPTAEEFATWLERR